MKVFVTGATGFVGSAVVKELIKAGHDVTGLARNEAAVKNLISAGAKIHKGDLEDLESLKSGASAADGIIHTGFIHDFARFKEVCGVDKVAIQAMGSVLVGTDKPLIVTAGTATVSPGRLAFEKEKSLPSSDTYPRATEEIASELAGLGVRVSVVRLSPTTHGIGDHGFIPMLINLAKEKGVSAYIGEGQNRWSAVHRYDAALLYRLILEKNPEAGSRFHAVSEEAITLKEIAEVIGKHLKIPVVSKSGAEAAAHFGWFLHFAGIDAPASSQWTRESLGWRPVQPTLIADLDEGSYFQT